MQPVRKLVRILVVTLGGCLAFAACPAADVVTEPRQKYGLGDLLQAAVSPDGQWMATAGQGGAFLWDLKRGTVRHRLEGHHARVIPLCFSPDGRVLLTGGLDRVVRAWGVEAGVELLSFEGHQSEITDLEFAPDGRSFVSTGGNTARVWSLGTGELLHSLVVPGAFLSRAVFTPDGNQLVTADSSPTDCVRLWDLASEVTIRSFGERITALAFVAGGQLVTGGDDLTGRVWDIQTGQVVRPLVGATQLILDLSASTNSSLVIAGCLDGRVIAWDASSGQVQHNFAGERLFSMTGIPGTNQVLTAHSDNRVRVKVIETGETLRTLEGHTTSTTLGVGFSPDGRYVLSGGIEEAIRLWNRTNAQPVRTFQGHPAGTTDATFSPDGTRILTAHGAPEHVAQLWNTETGQIEREFAGHSGWLLAAEFSPDGRRIATGAQDGSARLWDAATGGPLRVFPTPGTWIRAVAVSSNATLLASGATDGVARLWNATDGRLLHSFELNAGSVVALAFSPATGELLVAWEDGFLRLFDPATGGLKLDLVAPAAFLESAVFSPDGRFILGGEGWPFFTARLWDARSGAVLRVFAGHTAPVDSVAFDRSGTSILTGSDIVRRWSIADIAARLESDRKPGGLELRWSAGTLQHATHANGPWLDVPGATNPWLVATDQPSAFFRVHASADE